MEQTAVKDILYDPRSDTYKVRFGKFGEETMEIPGSSLHSENAGAILRGTDDDFFRKTYIGDWAEAARAKTATEAEEAARAGQMPLKAWDIYTHGQNVFLADAQGHRYSIIGDGIVAPVKDRGTESDIGSKADHRDSAANGAGMAVADRYPSIPYRAIIEDAIELLNKNKKLRLHKVSLNRFGTDYILTVTSKGHTALGKTSVRTVEVSINLATFDRELKIELDRDAGLGEGLNTNTYIKLRIAFLLYKTLSMTDENAKKFSIAGIFRVMFSSTQFDYSV